MLDVDVDVVPLYNSTKDEEDCYGYTETFGLAYG